MLPSTLPFLEGRTSKSISLMMQFLAFMHNHHTLFNKNGGPSLKNFKNDVGKMRDCFPMVIIVFVGVWRKVFLNLGDFCIWLPLNFRKFTYSELLTYSVFWKGLLES